MTTGQLIKQARNKKKLRQIDLAEKLGYEIPQFISLMENGHSKVPKNVAFKCVKILGIKKSVMIESLVAEFKKELMK